MFSRKSKSFYFLHVISNNYIFIPKNDDCRNNHFMIIELKLLRKIYISNEYYKKRIKQFIQTILFIKFKYIIAFNCVSKLKEEELEEKEEPDRLTLLLPQSKFDCVNKQTGYYADEDLNCEVFHYCQDNAKHSWICPEGFTFHQVIFNNITFIFLIFQRAKHFPYLFRNYTNRDLLYVILVAR